MALSEITPRILEAEEKLNQICSDKSKHKDYVDYWRKIQPINITTKRLDETKVADRWLFAYMSIHTTWRSNVAGYLALKDLGKMPSKSAIREAIQESGVGLTRMRTRGIYEFTQDYARNPESYQLDRPAHWYHGDSYIRNVIAKNSYGIGLAKVSFAFELIYPFTCQVVCLDTHILRLYGLSGTPSLRQYTKIEDHWLKVCDKHKMASPIVRHMYWDQIQNQPNTRYWSHVFE